MTNKSISAMGLGHKELNDKIRAAGKTIRIDGCCGQRFIGSGLRGKTVTINGTPGNALGAYLDGGAIFVNGNVQDAVGDTMNDGRIVVYGNAGDALGYAMRGGGIFVRGNAGYRTGIHMKQYMDKKPAIVIGGTVGSFLGEYLAGGIIVVLGLGCERALGGGDADAGAAAGSIGGGGADTGADARAPVGDFTGTGMHGGSIYIRTDSEPVGLPEQVTASVADDLTEIKPLLAEFAGYFGVDAEGLLKDRFYILKPNAKNPYKQLYTAY